MNNTQAIKSKHRDVKPHHRKPLRRAKKPGKPGKIARSHKPGGRSGQASRTAINRPVVRIGRLNKVEQLQFQSAYDMLLQRGRQKGFITEAEILHTVPEPERWVE